LIVDTTNELLTVYTTETTEFTVSGISQNNRIETCGIGQ